MKRSITAKAEVARISEEWRKFREEIEPDIAKFRKMRDWRDVSCSGLARDNSDAQNLASDD